MVITEEIAGVTRSLSETERRLLRAELQSSRRQMRSFFKRLIPVSVVIFGALYVATIVVAKESWSFAAAFWLAIGIAISAKVYFSGKRKYEANIHGWESALRQNEVHEIRIQSDTFAELEEIEDEGACYAFQLSEDRIVFVSGQDYYPSARFPNNDFSVMRVLDPKGSVIYEFTEKHGSKLIAKRKISAKVKSKLEIPGHLQIITGEMDELENLLRRQTSG